MPVFYSPVPVMTKKIAFFSRFGVNDVYAKLGASQKKHEGKEDAGRKERPALPCL